MGHIRCGIITRVSEDEVLNIAKSLGFDAISCVPFGSGHINDTFKVETNDGSIIVQKINTEIFKDADGMMDNIKKVTEHLYDAGKKTMRVLAYQKPWRVLSFIEGAHTVDILENPNEAYTAAKAFGAFQNDLAEFKIDELVETIPNFHNTVWRLEQLDKAAAQDKFDRLKNVKAEMDFVNARRVVACKILDLMAEGKIPVRITHNDTKINNVMLDDKRDEAIAVVDLDTVMPGCALYDFGDMVRTATASAAEDEKDLSKVYSKIEFFEALVKGYLSEAKFLNKYEIENLAFSGILITFTIGIRFLADYLVGDVYFKTDYEDHNLVRARNQFKMVESIEAQRKSFEEIVKTNI